MGTRCLFHPHMGYYTIYKLQDYLMGKYFEVETDHNNLRWIEASLNPAIVRMRVFMQGYHFDVRHIPGKLNIAADYLSRYHLDKTSPSSTEASVAVSKNSENSYESSG